MADPEISDSPPGAFIHIEFAGPGSADARLSWGGLTAGQRAAAVRVLDTWERDIHALEMAQAAQAQLATTELVRRLDGRTPLRRV